MTTHHAGSKPIVKSAKLHHLKRTLVERQELAPRTAEPRHARWRVEAGGVMVAAAIAAGAGAAAQAAPPSGPGLGGGGGGGLDFGPTPAAEVAVAPGAEAAPRETIIHLGPPIEMKGWDKVSDLKANPYVAAPKAKPRIVKKPRPSKPPAFEHVDDLKANPY